VKTRRQSLLEVMGCPETQDAIDRFVLELLRTGSMLSDLGAEVVEALPADAYPGEELGAVVTEMITGSIRTALVEAHADEVQRATELMAGGRDRVIEHLQFALELSRRVHGADDDQRRHG
jgi:hypothetical protein